MFACVVHVVETSFFKIRLESPPPTTRSPGAGGLDPERAELRGGELCVQLPGGGQQLQHQHPRELPQR
jgi:hypothetical protein